MTAMSIQIFRDLGAGRYMIGLVGALIAVVTVWVAFEGALAWRRTHPTLTDMGDTDESFKPQPRQ
jgi:hypothetical protein